MLGGQRYGNRILNEREERIIALVAQGLKNREVAQGVGTTEHVVKNYLRVIYDKLGLWNRVELALWYEARRHTNLQNKAALDSDAQGHAHHSQFLRAAGSN